MSERIMMGLHEHSEKKSSIVSLSPHYYICKSGEIDKTN